MARPTRNPKKKVGTVATQPDWTGWMVALIPASLFVYFASYLGAVSAGETALLAYDWIPSLGINLALHLDGLGLLFALIITGVGTLIMIYGGSYLADDAHLGRFYLFIIAFMVSMLGVVLSDNLMALFVFWELTSITSFMLIGYKHGYEDSRESAKMAFLVTGSGGLALLAGVILIGISAETWQLSEILAQEISLTTDPLYVPILILVLAGAFTKSAQFPFHFWLPGAMAAPTPVSAYLHSATMVKAGVYLLARLNPVLGNTEIWLYTLGGFGACTMVVGAYIAWQKRDLKQILAYSTVSALGTLVMLIGLGTETAIKGAMVFLLVHSMYKGTLFMVAGAIDHETGTRDIDKLGGLRAAMPYTFAAASLAVLSMSGIPPLYGFIGKEIIYEATLHAPVAAVVFTTLAVLGNALTILAGGLVVIGPFLGQPGDTPKQPHEAPLGMLLGPVTLGSLGLLLGLLVPLTKETFALIPFAPKFVADYLVNPPVGSILNEGLPHLKVTIWHGFNTAFMLSLVTVGLGVAGYVYRAQMRTLAKPLDTNLENVSPKQGYHYLLKGMLVVADWQTKLLQNGYLRHYLLTILMTTSTLLAYSLYRWVSPIDLLHLPNVHFYEYALAITILGATYISVTAQGRLTAVLSLGVVGLGMGFIFVLYGAPDLAMTQFSIETLMSILLVLLLYGLPRYRFLTTFPNRIRDAVVALTTGGLITILILAVTHLKQTSQLTPYFAKVSYELAQGRNVVNVILVDFRGVDTMGEIAVIAIAAIGVYALIRLKLEPETEPNLPKETIDIERRGKNP